MAKSTQNSGVQQRMPQGPPLLLRHMDLSCMPTVTSTTRTQLRSWRSPTNPKTLLDPKICKSLNPKNPTEELKKQLLEKFPELPPPIAVVLDVPWSCVDCSPFFGLLLFLTWRLMGSYKWGYKKGNYTYNPNEGTYKPTYSYPRASKYTVTQNL